MSYGGGMPGMSKNWGISKLPYFDVLSQFISKTQFPSPTLM